MTGTVRTVIYKEDINRSLLRIEADPLPMQTRNLILGEVFGMQDSNDDDLPFKMLDEEAANIGTDGSDSIQDPFVPGVNIRDVSEPDSMSGFSVSDNAFNAEDPFAAFNSPLGNTADKDGL